MVLILAVEVVSLRALPGQAMEGWRRVDTF